MPKRGRPRSENQRGKQIRIRLTEEEFNKLNVISEQMGITKSDFIRLSIFNKENSHD